MNTEDDLMLAERFAAIADRTDDGAWDDVVRRAEAGRSRRGVRSVRLVALLAVLAVAVAVALIAPWNGSHGSLSDRALAAIGSQPVLHIVAQLPSQARLVDIRTGAAEPVVQQEEIWYDGARGFKHTITRSGSSIVDDVLETPHGGYTPGGIVYDCAWIAAHPVEATKVGVSCNASGENGTEPRTVPRAKPTADPALAGFLDGYRQALSSGRAREIGAGEVDGRAVDWIEFKSGVRTERVALDRSTHKPLLVEDDRGWSLHIDTIETLPTSAANFARPTKNELGSRPTVGNVIDKQTLATDRDAIATALPGAVWGGQTLSDLPLAAAYRTQLKTGFVGGEPRPQTGTGLELDYGVLKDNGLLNRSQPFVQIHEAPTRALAFGYMWGFVRGQQPPTGKLYEPNPSYALAFTVSNNRYLTIQASTPELVRAAAQALQPVAGK